MQQERLKNRKLKKSSLNLVKGGNSRTGRNPQTGKPITISAKNKVE